MAIAPSYNFGTSSNIQRYQKFITLDAIYEMVSVLT